MSRIIEHAQSGLKGFDCNTKFTAITASQLATEYTFCLRYLSRHATEPHYDLDAAEVDLIMDAGLALMPVQHVAPDQHGKGSGWNPSQALGATYGERAAKHARDAGILPGTNVWLDLENVHLPVSPQLVAAYCTAWYKEVAAAGFIPGIYIGFNCGLNSSQLFYSLPFKHYWAASASSRFIKVYKRGYQMIQNRHDFKDPASGVMIDSNITQNDNFGDSVIWMRNQNTVLA